MQRKRLHNLTAGFAVAPFPALPVVAQAATVANPICPNNTALFNPDQGKDIVVPAGFKVSVFVSGLNAPTGIAFLGNSQKFEVYVLESGHGLPSVCNDQSSSVVGGDFSTTNPFTPDILVFNKNGTLIRGPSPSLRPPAAGSSPKGRQSTSRSNAASKGGSSSRPTRIRRPTLRVDKSTARASSS